jgi:multisubunit Na+/H+ antiporter MnhF subunit
MKELLTKEAVLLAVLPVISFIWALLFEIGYADSFGYSYSLIEIDLKIMIVSLAASAAVLVPMAAFYILFVRLACSDLKSDRLLALELILPVVILIPCCIAGFGNKIFNVLLIGSLSFALSKYAVIYLRALQYGWTEAVARAALFEGLTDRPPTFRVKEKLGAKSVLTIYFVIALMLVVSGLMVRGVGTAAAHWKTGYQTFVMEGKEYAVIAAFGDLVVLGGVLEEHFNGLVSILPKNSEKLVELRGAYFKDFLSTL